jgi:hypothetical protein
MLFYAVPELRGWRAELWRDPRVSILVYAGTDLPSWWVQL